MMKKNGEFYLCLEGPDCSGKTTLANQFSGDDGVYIFHEPGNTMVGDQIYRLFRDNIRVASPEGQVFLMNACRVELFNVIHDLVKRKSGVTVILDRYIPSTMVYQGSNSIWSIDTIYDMCMKASGGVVPDRTLIMIPNMVELENRFRWRGEDIPDDLSEICDGYFEVTGYLKKMGWDIDVVKSVPVHPSDEWKDDLCSAK